MTQENKTMTGMQPALLGNLIELRPLRREHAEGLVQAAQDGALWLNKMTVIPGPESIGRYIDIALAGKDAGTVMPYVIVDHASGKPIGSTRFWKIDHANRKLEIGHTWLSASVQRTGVNTEAKYLLLTQAFEAMHCLRVQFTTDELNEKSRAAILRIGAKQEGIVRNERIMPDGRQRNSVRFSIIDTEWPDIKTMLLRKLTQY